jgi:hypothetical protein
MSAQSDDFARKAMVARKADLLARNLVTVRTACERADGL